MIKIVVTGIAGRMGTHIAQLIRNTKGAQLVGGTEAPGASGVGTLLPEGPSIVDDISKCIESADVVIDFTSPKASLYHAEIARQQGKAMVVGTTGFTSKEKDQLSAALKQIPSVWAPNMSIGVNVLLKIAAEATHYLGHDYDIEIIEAHHRHKKDAPSGTALALGEAVAEARGKRLEDLACYHREGQTGERPQGQIGMQTIRGGDIVGDHSVVFAGLGENIELRHHAANRDNFARGAVRAALWLQGKAPGIYSMSDVLGLK